MGYRDFKDAAQKAARHAKQRDAMRKLQEYASKKNAELAIRKRADVKAALDHKLEIPEDLKLTDKYITDVEHNTSFNDRYGEYYMRLFEETNRQAFKNLSERVGCCHRFWFGDHYRLQRVFDVKSINLCKDKFCVNCQHLKQATRLKRFTPLFEKIKERYDLYHVVFTFPNVKGKDLARMLDRMQKSFRTITRYFSGDAPLLGVDFKQYGYVGAYRGFEVVANPFDDYHAHIHSVFVLRKDLGLCKHIIHKKFSYNYGIFGGRKFSDLEILLQKIFRLLINGEKVQLSSIRKLREGYSVTMDLVEGNEWHEVFKYATKLTKDGSPCLDYEQFKVLYYAFYRRKLAQGYGILYNVADDDDIDDEAIELYAEILAKLRLIEDPDSDVTFKLEKLVAEICTGNTVAISKKLVQKYLNELVKDEQVT